MKPWRRVTLRVLAAHFPGSERLPGFDGARAERFLDQILREAPLRMRAGLHLCTLLFLVSTPLTVRRLRPALWLPAEQLDRHAWRFATHRSYLLRQAALLLKTIGSLCWGADPGVRLALGMRPYGPDPGTWRQA